ncbi:MAG: hypothetical protein QX203_06040 [Methylococcaceae bacterium]
MSHLHAIAGQVKSGAGTAASMNNMTLGSMMSEGMGTIMKTSGLAASAGSSSGKSVIGKIFTHPLALFGLGVVAGCYIYKYRKSIISASGKAR